MIEIIGIKFIADAPVVRQEIWVSRVAEKPQRRMRFTCIANWKTVKPGFGQNKINPRRKKAEKPSRCELRI